MVDGFLYSVPSDTNPNDGRLHDPTVADAGIVVGSGILLADSSALSGVGLSISTGTGALSDSASSVSGIGQVTDTSVTGSGILAVQSAHISGVGIGLSTGTGSLASGVVHLLGAGLGISTGSGALAAQNQTLSGVGIVQWIAAGGHYLLEDGFSYLQEGSGFYLREEIDLGAQTSQVSGEGLVTGEGTFRFTPYVAPPRRQKKKPVRLPEPTPVVVTVSAPIQLSEPISYQLEVDTLSEAGESIERVLSDLDELRDLVHKEVARKRKRRKRILALITIQ